MDEATRKSAIDVALEMSLERDERHEAHLSACRALVQQWTTDAESYTFYGQPFHPRADAIRNCAKQLAALCPEEVGRESH